MDAFPAACQEILQRISSGEVIDAQGLARAKIKACREFGLRKVPSNSEILAAVSPEEKVKVSKLLRRKFVRSVSGVSVITVMVEPRACPHGRCIYCPGGPSFGTPSSYTGHEPASARALQAGYNPYTQVKGRIEQLRAIGHDVDKIELIIFGGTVLAYPPDYLRWFVTQCLNAMSGADAKNLGGAQQAAEVASIRNSDIAIETRPDYSKEPHIDLALGLGATRVELGVQTLCDDIYKLVKRGHRVEDVAEATRIAKDAGFTVAHHYMPNLPGSSYERDIEMFETVFEDERFKPDAIKIYPTLVMSHTELCELWQRGEYTPYPLEQVVELIAKAKKRAPPWVRIQRIQRDIPANLIAAGVKRGDLRNLVQKRLREKGGRCRCIRCREVGHIAYKLGVTPNPDDIKLMVERYRASDSEEVFLSCEDIEQDILIGLLRLRYPSGRAHRPEIKEVRSTLVRELHVYGPLVPVGAEPKEGWQHRGYGAKLLKEAERISKEEFDAQRIIVLSGIGMRNYYRRFGYELEGPYMVKGLSQRSQIRSGF